MIRLLTLAALLCNSLLVSAQTVSLTGTIKKTGGTIGLSGVTVSLAKFSNMSTTTDADGAFVLNGSIAVRFQSRHGATPFQFMLKNNAIVFSSTFPYTTGSMDIFSSDGKTITSIRFNALKAGKHTIALPKLGVGLNIVRITIGSESFTHALVCLGKDLFLKNGISSTNTGGNFRPAKKSAVVVVDTLVAEKDGYTTKKTAITSYSQKDIVIILDTCTVNCPIVFIDSAFYLANNGYGRVDSVEIHFRKKLALIPDSIIVYWPLKLVTLKRSIYGIDPAMRLSDDSMRIAISLASNPFPAEMTAARTGDRLGITFNRPNNNPGVQESSIAFPIADRVGPLLMSALAIERISEGAGIDTMVVSFSEVVTISSLTGEALHLIQNGASSPLIFLNAVNLGNNRFKLVVSSRVKPQLGDSLRINPMGLIIDSFGNYAHPLNRPVPLQRKGVPGDIEMAYYLDNEGQRADGVVDSVVIQFNKKVNITDMDLSLEWAGESSINKAEHLSPTLYNYVNGDSSMIEVFVRGQFSGLLETAVRTRGAMRATVRYNSLNESVTGNVVDSTAPVLVDSALYRPFSRPIKPAIPDTLYVTFSEPVTSIMRSYVKPFITENTETGMYGLILIMPDVMAPEWTNNFDKYRYKFIVSLIDGTNVPKTGDSLWIDPLAAIRDAVGAVQDNANNRKVLLYVLPGIR